MERSTTEGHQQGGVCKWALLSQGGGCPQDLFNGYTPVVSWKVCNQTHHREHTGAGG